MLNTTVLNIDLQLTSGISKRIILNCHLSTNKPHGIACFQKHLTKYNHNK